MERKHKITVEREHFTETSNELIEFDQNKGIKKNQNKFKRVVRILIFKENKAQQ